MDPASSVAGLIGLAGLLIKSASFLYRFCSSFKQVAEEVSSLVRSIENLQALLRYIEEILRQDAARGLQSTQFIAEWKERIEECERDLRTWLQAIQLFQSGDPKVFRKCVRNLKAAADEGRFRKMRLRLSAHYEHLSLHLDILNGNIGLKNAQILVANRAAADRSDANHAELQRSTAYSLKGITDTTKRIEALGKTTNDRIQSGWKEFRAKGSSNHIETLAFLERIEQRCLDTQTCLLRSIQKSRRPTKGSPVSRMPLKSRNLGQVAISSINEPLRRYTSSTINTIDIHHLVQVVKPAILIYESCGSLSQALLPFEDPVYTSLNQRDKIALVQQLQNMRLIMWLLRRDRVFCFIGAVYRYPNVSTLALEGGIMFNYFRSRVGPIRIARTLKENEEFNMTCSWLSSPTSRQVDNYDTSSHWMLQMARSHYFLDAHHDGMCYWREACKKHWQVFFGLESSQDRPDISEEIIEVFRKLLSHDYRLEDLLLQAIARCGRT